MDIKDAMLLTLKEKAIWTWGDICEVHLVGPYAVLKKVPAQALFENLNRTDTLPLTKKEKEELLKKA